MKKIPYGKSSFTEIRESDMYYVDKTKYIEVLETMPDYQFFIRPRRFGKSLFISMLECYYDIKEKENFGKLFEDLYISKNPTEEKNKYLVLRIDFAPIVTAQGEERLIESFDNIVSSNINKFINKYSDLIKIKELPKQNWKAEKAIIYLDEVISLTGYKIVLLIDEYDNYANEIMTSNKDLYYKIANEGGYAKTFYKTVKSLTTSIISRIFMTGVSPIFLDDLTSGPNMFSNITNKKILNNILGFTNEELEKMVDYFKLEEYVDRKKLLEDMKYLYNGYKFNEEVEETVYNTDMVLYLINEINLEKKYPKNMIDENVKTDYGKIRKIAINFGNAEELNDIGAKNLEIGPVTLPDRIKLEDLYNPAVKDTYYRALMYYMGMLTIKRAEENSLILGIPNYVIKSLYWDYIVDYLGGDKIVGEEEIKLAMRKMRLESNIEEIIKIYQNSRQEILSYRDLRWYNELTSKVIFLMLVKRDGMYMIKSEHESTEGYIDVYLKASTNLDKYVNYNYVIEFKHIKEKGLKTKVKKEKALEKAKQEASEQLDNYMQDYRIQEDSGGKEIKKLVIITLGKNDLYGYVI